VPSETHPTGGDELEGVVFIVDDDPSVRKSLTRLFTAAGLQAESFDSARAFLDHEPAQGPVCLVLDQRLPGPTGLELQKSLSGANESASVIFLTAHADVEMSVEAMKAGAVDFLTKPVEGAHLIAAVREALAKSASVIDERREREGFLVRVRFSRRANVRWRRRW
jgi:FixJ family two-component response regulator